jgi:hypothetical protein
MANISREVNELIAIEVRRDQLQNILVKMSAPGPKGPYKLVTVNTAPERAKRLIGRMVEALKDRYTIIYAANCESVFFL